MGGKPGKPHDPVRSRPGGPPSAQRKAAARGGRRVVHFMAAIVRAGYGVAGGCFSFRSALIESGSSKIV